MNLFLTEIATRYGHADDTDEGQSSMDTWAVPPGRLADPVTAKQAWLRVILQNNMSFNSCSSESFRQFWKTFVREKNLKAATLPTRGDLAGAVLDAEFEASVKALGKEISQLGPVTGSTDGATRENTSYWTVSLTGLDLNFRKHNLELGTFPIYAPKHSNDVLAVKIKEILEKFGVDMLKLVGWTTDEGGAAPYISLHFTNSEEIHCIVHLGNTSLRNA